MLIQSLSQLLGHASQIRWSVKHAIPEASIGTIFGASGAYKSFLALDYALHRCYGMPWIGRKTIPGLPVYLAAEGGGGLAKRIRAWHQHHNRPLEQCPLLIVPVALMMLTEAPTLAAEIARWDLPITDLVVDTLSQTYEGEENSANDMAAYYRCLGRTFVAHGITTTVIHHTGHSATERPRGSSVIQTNSDWMYGVHHDKEGRLTTLECLKQKDGEVIKDTLFQMRQIELGRDEDGDPITSLVPDHLSDPRLAAQLSAGTGARKVFLRIAERGMSIKAARAEFYESLDGSPEALKKSWQRCLSWAIESGFASDHSGKLVCLQPASRDI